MSTITRSATVAPVGWYPDPAGSSLLRLWSGNSWTTQLEPRGPLTTPEYRYLADGTIIPHQEY